LIWAVKAADSFRDIDLVIDERVGLSGLEGEMRLWKAMGCRICLFGGKKNIGRVCCGDENGKYDARSYSKIQFLQYADRLRRKKGAYRTIPRGA
jgi:hypothetical protein